MPTKKKLHCGNCGKVTYLSNTSGNYLELKPTDLSPWRCDHCGAVWEFNDPENPAKGYYLANNPNAELEKMEEDQKMQDTPERRAMRRAQAGNRKSRRQHAKRMQIFRDKSHDTWRKTNRFMKGEQ